MYSYDDIDEEMVEEVKAKPKPKRKTTYKASDNFVRQDLRKGYQMRNRGVARSNLTNISFLF